MKHLFHSSARALALILAVGQIGLVSAFATFDNGFSYTYPIGEGTTYTRIEGKNGAGLQKANAITYTPNPSVSPVITYASDKLYGGNATIMNAAKYLQNQGSTVLGGTNADFFVMSSGVPIGLVIDKGELVSSDAWQYAVGFTASGNAVMGQPTMSMKIAGNSGTVTVSYFNKTRTTAGLYLLDKNYDSSTHFSANGTNIILERVDNTPVTVNGSVKLKVINKGTGSGSLTITDNQMVLTKSDGCTAAWVDFQVGEEVTLSVYSSDSAWDDVQYAVGGKLLMNGGSVTTSGIDAASTRTARSAIGKKADGSVVLYEIDGLQSSHSVGLTAAELGQQLKDLGCTEAICLDGGGSSAMILRKPGEGDISLISSPSDGSQRSCANYIFFVNKALGDGVTRHAVLTPSYRYLLPGASTWFSVKGVDSSYRAAADPSDVTYAVSGDLGVVTDQTFTAGTQTGTTTISAMGGDGSTGAMTVCITNDINAITVSNGKDEVSSLSVKSGGSVDLTGTAYHLGQKMASADTAFQWSVSGNIGSVDANGVFKAANTPASGTLTCSIGAVSKTINISVGMAEAQSVSTLATFESTQPCTAENGITLTQTTEFVARGKKSLCASYDGTALSEGTIQCPAATVSNLRYLSLYAKVEGAAADLTAVYTGADGAELTSPFSSTLGSSWKLINTTIPEGAVSFTGLRFKNSGTGTTNSALYLDQIVLSSNHAITNTDSPALSLSKSSISISAGASATITGTATMEGGSYPVHAQHISVKVDGKAVSGAVSMSGSSLTVKTAALTAGTHTVAITASDDAGNLSRKSVTITAGSTSNVFSDTAGNWASGYAALLKWRGIMQGENVNGKVLFNPARNLTRAEFAVTMARVLGLDTSSGSSLSFADNASIPSWARGAVYAVSQAGIMSGKSRNNGLYFDPTAQITRAEVMTVIGRSLPVGYAQPSLSYKDAASVPSWASDGIKTCISAGIVGGYSDNTLRPQNKITRAEIAKILALL